MTLEPVIGLEIHVQLKTKSKMFCGCDNHAEDAPPNTAVCPICMGHPGTLPVTNRQAVEWGVRVGLALNCTIPEHSKFDRKNYFYPDLPKGYQISQYDEPVAKNGYFEFSVPTKEKNERLSARVRITRAHLEEDAAKLLHGEDGVSSFVDFNRAGTPLVEIVTEPDFCSPLEAKTFLQELRLLMRYLKVSDADMEKGHLRCDANISLRPVIDDPKKEKGSALQLYPKTEVKNINSFRAVERALEYEILRQTRGWEEGKPPMVSTTRGWNDQKQVTEEQRTKEAAHDYRYFPEPDLPTLSLAEIAESARGGLPELPQARRRRFADEYGFSVSDARTLTDDPELADYTEQVISELAEWLRTLPEVEGTNEEVWTAHKSKLAKLISGWLLSKLGGLMAEEKVAMKTLKITPENFAELIALIYGNKISSSAAQTILLQMMRTGADPSHVMEEKNLGQMSDEVGLNEVVVRVLAHHPEQIKEYKAGKVQVIKFLVGVVMKETEGRANPKRAEELLAKKMR